MASDRTYWAAREVSELAVELGKRIQNSNVASHFQRGVNERAARAYRYYFGMSASGVHTTSQVLRDGEQGELAAVHINHARSLVNTLLSLLTTQKIVWNAKAVAADYNSIRECELAAALLEYYWSEQRYAQYAVRALEEAIVLGEGFVFLEWDKQAGEDSMPTPDMTGTIRTGDIRVANVSSWDVFRDTTRTSYDDLDWCIIRRYQNKYTLAAEFPEQEETILDTPDPIVPHRGGGVESAEYNDCVPVYHFFHKMTPAVPTGRYCKFLSDECVLSDGTLADSGLSQVPLYRVAAGELFGTPFGYTPFYDILGIQELYDSLQTSIASNQSTFATQCIVTQQGSEFSPESIAGGMKVLYVPPGSEPPKALQLTATPTEVFRHVESLQKNMELSMGLNSVVRGSPQSGEQSGAALALLSAQALQQSNVLNSSYIRFVEAVGAGVLELIRNNLSLDKQLSIVGKGSAFLLAANNYNGKSFKHVKQVSVEVGNPLSQSASGRLTIAKDLLQGQLVKTPEQYIQVLTTGRLEPLTKGITDELLLIRGENEALARGEIPPVIYIDDHTLHAREHRSVLANMEARKDAKVIEAVMQHLREHETVLYTTEPALLALMGQQPPQAPPPPDLANGNPIPANLNPGQGGPPPGGPEGQVPKLPGNPAVGQEPQPARMPTNPDTGAPYDTATGGGKVQR